MKFSYSIATVVLFAVFAGVGYGNASESRDRDLSRLANLMTGSFSSEEQAKQDPYFAHIILHTRRIWPKRKDAIWLYVEQAEFNKPQNPYRQRIYKLFRDRRGIISKVFEMRDPTRLVGAWRDGFDLSILTAADIVDRPGCELVLKKKGKGFEGSTIGRDCVSTLRGASYATSKVEITEGRIMTWDRGWNDRGEQVWGSTKGGYVFRRIGRDNEGNRRSISQRLGY